MLYLLILVNDTSINYTVVEVIITTVTFNDLCSILNCKAEDIIVYINDDNSTT